MPGSDHSHRTTKRSRPSDATQSKMIHTEGGRAKRRRTSQSKDEVIDQTGKDITGSQNLPVASDSQKMVASSDLWTLSDTIAGQFNNIDPIITPDEEYLFVGLETAVHVYSAATSRLFRTLQLKPGHCVIGYSLSHVVKEHLYIFTSAGSVSKWHWLSGEEISYSDTCRKTVSAGLCVDNPENSSQHAMISLRERKDGKKEVVVVTLNDNKPHETIILETNIRLTQIKVVGNSRVVVAYGGHHVLIGIACFAQGGFESVRYTWREVTLPVSVTCVDARHNGLPSRAEGHSSSEKKKSDNIDLVLGESEGSILIYHDIVNSFEKGNGSEGLSNLAPRRLHWHRGPVNVVRWSKDGNYIISGGHESVMVLWQLDTGRKQFLPHLSSPICNIVVSPTGNSYVVKLADNCIMVLSARELQPFATIIGLQLCPKVAGPMDRVTSGACGLQRTAAAALHPQHPDQLLITVPASRQVTREGSPLANSSVLQTYDIRTNSHLSRQALARTNATTLRVGPEGSQVVAPDVTHLGLSQDGQWMATVDEWCPYTRDVEALGLSDTNGDLGANHREVFLKFWRWNNAPGLWELATRIDGPHFSDAGSLPVLDLASRPHSHEYATIGSDMVLRFWCPSIRHRSGLKPGNDAEPLETWKCRNTIDLKGYVNNEEPGRLSAASMSFSEDGSVLAVCPQQAHSSITGLAILIDAQDCSVRYNRAGLYSGGLCAAEFLGCHLVISSTQSVSIWDTVDDTVKTPASAVAEGGLSDTEPQLLAVNPKTQTFATTTKHFQTKKSRRSQFRIQVYDLHSMSLLSQFPLRQCPLALLSNPHTGDYVVVDAKANLQRLSSAGKRFNSTQNQDLATQLNSGLTSIFGKQSHNISSYQSSTDLPSSQNKELAHVFGDAPPFVLPPAGILFRDVVRALTG